MKNHLDELNAAQRSAAEHINGPILILAGAGAGKTKTITHRIVNLIGSGILGNNILAITFTNKAAREMRERVEAAVGKEFQYSSMPMVCTFHSLGVRIIKENAALVGVTKNFTILDEGDAVSLVKEAVKSLDLNPKEYDPKRIRHAISRHKNNFITYDELATGGRSYLDKATALVWQRYEGLCKKENSLDFDDLLLKSVELLAKNKNVLEGYQERWKYIHVDEYQDTNEVQYRLAKLLAQKYKNICVVGDGDQNIYGWRGANIKNILNFETDYPNATMVLLEENYRSTSTILEAANEIIRKNTMRKDKNLFTKKDGGEKITLFEAYDEVAEANFTAEKVVELMDSGVSVSDIAVLYRANFQSRVFEEAFLMHSLPYQVLGTRFFERKEVKDTLSYIRAALNPESLSDLKRIVNFPSRGIGKATIAKVFAGGRDQLPAAMQLKLSRFFALLENIKEKAGELVPSELLKYVIKASRIEDELKTEGEEGLERLENIKELVTLASRYDVLPLGEGIEKLLEDGSLASEQDSLENKSVKNGVRLMTVHASKGLEFKYVFIVGLEQDLFPHRRSDSASTEDREEERRLFYVALTRAKEKLYLSYASIRTLFGNRQINAPSEFLYDMPAHLVEKETAVGNKIIFFD